MKKNNYSLILIGLFLVISVILVIIRPTEAFADSKNITENQINEYARLVALADSKNAWSAPITKDYVEKKYLEILTKDDDVSMDYFLKKLSVDIDQLLTKSKTMPLAQFEAVIQLVKTAQEVNVPFTSNDYEKLKNIVMTQNEPAIKQYIMSKYKDIHSRKKGGNVPPVKNQKMNDRPPIMDRVPTIDNKLQF